jgi:hypothetical protein
MNKKLIKPILIPGNLVNPDEAEMVVSPEEDSVFKAELAAIKQAENEARLHSRGIVLGRAAINS